MNSPKPRHDPEYLRLLMSKIALKDYQAFRCIYNETSSRLFGYALRIIQKPALADDVLQESFIAIWRNAALYDETLSAPLTWMTTIVRNKAFDLLRANIRYVEMDADNFDMNNFVGLIDPILAPPEMLEMSRLACSLKNCMAQLDISHSQVVYMAFYGDLSHSEIAHKLNLPIGTVKTWIRRSLERIGTCLVKLEVSKSILPVH